MCRGSEKAWKTGCYFGSTYPKIGTIPRRKVERDVEDTKCEHAPRGISESSRKSLKLNSRGLTVVMAACSTFSISTDLGKSKARTM